MKIGIEIVPEHALRFFLLTQYYRIHILSTLMETAWKQNPHLGKDSPIRNPDVILREEDPDGALLFNPDTNQIRVINGTGLFIWKHCDGKKDLPAIVVALKKTFDNVPETEVEDQVKAFADDMLQMAFWGFPSKRKMP